MATITQRVIKNARRRGVKVYSRWRWGTLHAPTYQWRRKNRAHHLLPDEPSDTLVQHITVTFDSGVLVGHFWKDMRTVERIGWERFRTGVSYNFVIDMETGQVGLGQSLDAAGSHTINNKKMPGFSENQNYVALAIAFMGMPGKIPTRRAIAALVNLIAALIEEKALTEGHDYLPHSYFAWKSCPTPLVTKLMPAVNRKARGIGSDDVSADDVFRALESKRGQDALRKAILHWDGISVPKALSDSKRNPTRTLVNTIESIWYWVVRTYPEAVDDRVSSNAPERVEVRNVLEAVNNLQLDPETFAAELAPYLTKVTISELEQAIASVISKGTDNILEK